MTFTKSWQLLHLTQVMCVKRSFHNPQTAGGDQPNITNLPPNLVNGAHINAGHNPALGWGRRTLAFREGSAENCQEHVLHHSSVPWFFLLAGSQSYGMIFQATHMVMHMLFHARRRNLALQSR